MFCIPPLIILDIEYEWLVAKGLPFPMPLEVEVNGKLVVLPMTDMTGELAVGPGDIVITDPQSKVLRHMPFVEAFGKADRKRRTQEQQERREMRERLDELEKLVGDKG